MHNSIEIIYPMDAGSSYIREHKQFGEYFLASIVGV